MKTLVRYPLLTGALAGLLAFALLTFIVAHEERRLVAEQRHEAYIRLSTLRANLEGLLNANLVALRSIEAEVAIDPPLAEARFSRLARELIGADLQIRHMALIPDLVIRHIYPLEGNEEALGVDLRTIPDQIGAIQQAIRLNKIIIAGPVELVQGGRGLIARVPVHTGPSRDQLWGIVAAVIDADKLLAAAALDETLWQMSLAIRGLDASGASGPVFFGLERTFAMDAVTLDVKLPYGSWSMALYPPAGWQAPADKLLQMWLFGAVFVLLLAVASYFLALAYRDKARAVETAVYRANYDGLTGLMNRHCFSRQLELVMNESRREQQSFSLMFTDLDHFKQINDSYGHAVGDQLLQQFAARLEETLRRSDLVARLAGDEFVMLVRHVDSATRMEMLAEKLLERLNDAFNIDGQLLSITSSIGIASFPEDGDNPEQLLKNADHAMYAAKSSGRNRVFFFNRSMRLEVERHLQLHNEILRGLEEAQFEVYYQPLLHLGCNSINKCEALIRWQHPRRGLVSPVEFIPVAEQTGAIRALGNFVLEQVCADLQQFHGAGLELKVTVNRSVNEFNALDADHRWLSIMNAWQVRGDEIVFEITESLLMEQNVKQLAIINNLRRSGVQFAIDDFGTGYSALNYLRSYPVEFLKIDRSFIMDLLLDEQDRTLVDVIIRMGKTLEIKVVAEGVESQAQLDLLKTLGCDYIQGYFISRPLPRAAFIRFCQEWQLVTSG